MDLFVPANDVAKIMNWSAGDLRALRRALKPSLPIQRGSRQGAGRGKTPDQFALYPLLKWLDKILSNGLTESQADELASRAEPLI